MGQSLQQIDQLSNDQQALVLGMIDNNLVPVNHVYTTHPWIGQTHKGSPCLSGLGEARMRQLEQSGYACTVEFGRQKANAQRCLRSRSAGYSQMASA